MKKRILQKINNASFAAFIYLVIIAIFALPWICIVIFLSMVRDLFGV
jgi:hypothetical protein